MREGFNLHMVDWPRKTGQEFATFHLYSQTIHAFNLPNILNILNTPLQAVEAAAIAAELIDDWDDEGEEGEAEEKDTEEGPKQVDNPEVLHTAHFTLQTADYRLHTAH